MEADFSGWATKAGLLCSDGRTIMANAFRHQDQTKVPLVWQHGHTDPENVLGHAILENRDEGVYCYGFFNKSPKADHSQVLLEHGDINMMSIWANELMERSKKVLHGTIREVSLVLSGANPGAVIENVTIRHSGDDEEVLEDEAIIYTGLELEHQSPPDEKSEETKTEEEITHAAGDKPGGTDDDDAEPTVQDVYDSLTDEQKQVVHYMLGEAIAATKSELKQDNLGDAGEQTQEGNNTMAHNVFEKGNDTATQEGSPSATASGEAVLSHADVAGIVADATRMGSLKEAVKAYAISHGIDNIDVLFPEARTLGNTPDWNKRHTEWVAQVIGGASKSPFSRVKTFTADLTEDEARAKGYIKGDLKKEEFFSVAKRVTTPTTIYKKQKLDRDDMIDITDFDVVQWLRGEMRLMLDEEIARAVLIGDGRDIAADDKINQQNIRPIASDHQLYATTVNVNIDDANSSVAEIIDAIILNRSEYRGTGRPTFFTTETYISKFLLLKDTVGRRIYKNLEELAAELRVEAIVPVEVMESEDDLVGILVNMTDYVIGADRGGAVSMFDDFDIDYNQYKYLIETRISGALNKLKSALVVRKVASTATAVVPTDPTFDGTTITIPTVTGVTYKRSDTDATVTGTLAVPVGESREIYAVANSTYYFASDADTRWTFRKRS